MQMKGIQLLIQCLLLSTAQCDFHSLEFLSTGRVHPADGPQFEQLTVLDKVPISYCDSLTKREVPKPTLETQNLPEDCEEAYYNMLVSLYEIPELINSTVYVQRRRGCIQSADGTVSAFEDWAVNGLDFLSFDPETQRWTSHSPSAVTVKLHWNNNNVRNSVFKQFLTKDCPLLIQKVRLRPTQQHTELHVFGKPTVNTDEALLRCHVTSTDKSLSSIHLIGEGASKASWITITGPVPSADGSVILRLTAWISLRQNTNKYGCRVPTGSHNITVYWDGNTVDGRDLYNLSNVRWKILNTIVGICSLMLAVPAITCVTICLLKYVKKKPRRPATVDPQLIEQFTRIADSVSSPDLQNVLISYTRRTDGRREWDQWAVSITRQEHDFFNPEYCANKVNEADQIESYLVD